MARGKHNRKKGPEPADDGEETIRPHSVQGRCAFCVCGGRIEMPGPSKEDREKMRSGSRIFHKIHCPECIKLVLIEDPWMPRDSGRA